MHLPKTLRYGASVRWDGKSGGEVACKNPLDFRVDMPLEFSGEGRYPCPDQVFLASIGGCLLTTFLNFKNRFDLKVEDVQVTVKGEVALVGAEGYRIREVEAFLQIKVREEEKSLAMRCGELARDYCHITRTIEKALPIKVYTEVEEEREENQE